jgi:hypothetical protein
VVQWRVLGLARARLGLKAAVGRWLRAVAQGAPGTLGHERPDSRSPLARTLDARVWSGNQAVPVQGRVWASEHGVTNDEL